MFEPDLYILCDERFYTCGVLLLRTVSSCYCRDEFILCFDLILVAPVSTASLCSFALQIVAKYVSAKINYASDLEKLRLELETLRGGQKGQDRQFNDLVQSQSSLYKDIQMRLEELQAAQTSLGVSVEQQKSNMVPPVVVPSAAVVDSKFAH